ncbi:UDP-4-amino-4,6-dideoxy-N-acetyl-beta-L-altrosamine N-acetyltransferase [Helicobacter burdigaliensis]|uniref:UDP-4-amino-4, 6-dideoxy-N-acetyl-beta-L-altrosamine N-acetyltransferase n=1 Tax=Helicobacter burdigaliensis TaxID=2315334 RepID=UPI0039EBF067
MQIDREESLEVLQMRNQKSVREFLYNKEEITLKEHLEFLESLKKSTKKYFLIKFQNKNLGSINFEIKKGIVEFGFYANPFLEVAGIGRILEQISIFYTFFVLHKEILELEVFKENRAVVNLHKKFGFRMVEEKERILRMQLKKY